MNTNPETQQDLQDHYCELVKMIVRTFEEPENWPLDDAGKNRFMRAVYGRAKAIKTSKAFVLDQVFASAKANIEHQHAEAKRRRAVK